MSAPVLGVLFCTTCAAVYRADFRRCPLDGGSLAVGDDPLIGRTLADGYEVQSLIGEGGMGRVYRARRHGRDVAIKVLIGDLAAQSIMRQRFAREAEAARQLAHPNIVGVLDYGHTLRGLPYLVMELVEGRLLSAILHEAPMAPARVIRIARQLCEGLAHAHQRGVIHRDFKPDNILVCGEFGTEVPRIVDFGLALSLTDTARLTLTGVACTPAYAAPEQLRGGAIDSRVDLYALGTTVFEMLTGGMLPFDDGSTNSTVHAKLANEAPPVQQLVPDVPPALAALVDHLIAHDRDRRPRTAQAVRQALDACARAPTARVPTSVLRASARQPDVSFPGLRPDDRGWLVALCVVSVWIGIGLGLDAVTMKPSTADTVVKMPLVHR